MYMVTMAARISQIWLSVEDRKAWAAPWNWVRRAGGRPSSFSTASTAFTAAPSEESRATLKEMVATGNWPWRAMESWAGRSSSVAMLVRGTGSPEEPRTWMFSMAAGPRRKRGATSSTTLYWLVWVKMVDIRRWPRAS